MSTTDDNATCDGVPVALADSAMRTQLDYALENARLGYKVFPCVPDGKEPKIRDWERNATTDEAQIRTWWGRWPDANIGAAVGASGITVLDVDTKSGKPGIDSLSALEENAISLPRTRVVRTPSGGFHFHMRGMTASKNGQIGDGLDVKSMGGYVLMPGSFIAGNSYGWHKRQELEQAPEWFVEKVGAPKQREDTARVEPDCGWDNNLDVAWARDYLMNEAPPAVESRKGDQTTYDVACVLRDHAISEALALELMVEHYNPRCVPPWPLDNRTNECLRAKVENAYRYAVDPPGTTSIAGDFLDPPPEPIRRRFRELSLRELKDVTAPRWLVDRLLPEQGLAVVYGQPKACKTFWAIDLSLSIAAGVNFHGLTLTKGRATYVAAEGGTARLRDRARAWFQVRGIDADSVRDWGLVARRINLTDPAEVDEFIRALDGRRDLVVIDTLARCMSGDENSQKDMGAFIAGCDKIREATGAAVLIVHHEGKDASKGARGSNALRGAIDAGIRMRRDTDGSVCVSIEDQRDDEPLSPMRFRLENVVMSGIEDASAALVAVSDNRKAADETTIFDLAADMIGESKGRLDKAVSEQFKLSLTTAQRRTHDLLGEGRRFAVGHKGMSIWLERIDAKNPRSGLRIRGEAISDSEDLDTKDNLTETST